MPSEDFKRIVESLRIAVAITDPQGVVAFANPAFAQLAGRGARAVVGIALPSLFHGEDARRVRQNLARIAERNTASALLEVRVATTGEDQWVQLSLQPALDARDRPAGVVAALHDIATQRETESALNLSAARLLALAEASPGAALIENSAGEVELANEAFCRLLGIDLAPQSLLGLDVADVLAKAKQRDPDSLLERQPIVVDEAPVGALWTQRTAATVGDGEERGASEIALIEQIGQELSVALEGLSAISIRAQQMEFDPLLVEHFQRIRASTESALGAIGDLVDFSKVQGGIELHRAEFGLRAAIADLVARVAHDAEESGCRLRVKVEQDVADQLEGDVGRLGLILKNLLDNAFQICPGADVLLQITPEYVTEAGIQLSFSVMAGLGSAEKSALRASAEAGMGVAVARFMVGAMGGRLVVGARPGADALYAFTIEFPVRPAPPAPRRATYVSLVGLPVLVVSGDADQRDTLTQSLRGWRMIPMEADNAAMAISLLERMHEEGSPVPLVLLTNNLPVQDGFLLAFRIRHHPKLSATLMMMVATEGRPGDAITCRENGIAAYLRYPVGDKQLNDAIVAVTGASVDADEVPTLVTRHSLREQRRGATILLIDGRRDSHMLAAHILRKRDCSLVVAADLAEAIAALDQDVYDLVLADTSIAELDGGDAAQVLRSHLTRDPGATKLYATSLDHSPSFREEKLSQGFDGTLGKPLRRDQLLGVLQAIGKLAEETTD
jgi:PAS domain S-box-containing protein